MIRPRPTKAAQRRREKSYAADYRFCTVCGEQYVTLYKYEGSTDKWICRDCRKKVKR